MIDFLYTRKPLIKTSKWPWVLLHESMSVLQEVKGHTLSRTTRESILLSPHWRQPRVKMGGSKPRRRTCRVGRGCRGRGQVGHTGLQSPLRWNGLSVEHFCFWKHKKQSSEFKLARRESCQRLCRKDWKHSRQSHVKYSLGFFLSLRNHPEVWECAREHDWYIISVSGFVVVDVAVSRSFQEREYRFFFVGFFCVWIYNN